MASIFEKVLVELKEIPNAHFFMEPVNPKKVVDYYNIIRNPMNLRKMKEKISEASYCTRAEFLGDVQLILSNSRLYNGDASDITAVARDLVQLAARRVAEKEDKLIRLEKAINPLLDDNDIVAFTYVLSQALEKAKAVPKSFAFHHPVDGRKIKSYYDKISNPMDLGTMGEKLKKQSYTTLEAFTRDLDQIHENSLTFNGPASVFTAKADEIRSAALAFLQAEADNIKGLEAAIQRALEQAETESLVTGASSIGEDSVAPMGDVEEDASHPPQEGGGEWGGEEGGEDGGDEEEEEDYDPTEELMATLERGGQLHADLAMSDSDEDDDGPPAAKLPREEDLLGDL